MIRERYPTDLTDAQWKRIEPHVPKPKSGGHPVSEDRREIVNAIFSVVRNGCTWRALPHDFPRWQTVYHYFRLWRDDRSWQQLHDRLRDETRVAAGRDPSPSAAIIDAQSVKTAETGYPRTGGGRATGLMAARLSRVANGISPSIRSDYCLPSWRPLPMSQTVWVRDWWQASSGDASPDW